MDYALAVQRIYDSLEKDDLGLAVMACLRVARHARDYFNTAIFLHELGGGIKERREIFVEDTRHLVSDQRKALWKNAVEVWLEERSHDGLNSGAPNDDGTDKVYTTPAGQIKDDLRQHEDALEDIKIPKGVYDTDTVTAFAIASQQHKGHLRTRLRVIQEINERIRARCLNYAIRMERQMEAQRKPEIFLHQVQLEVNNYFKTQCEDIYNKLCKAAQLADSNDPHDYSILLTLVRQSIKATADYFYPPISTPIVCADGKERMMGEDKYLNRLQEYLAQLQPSSSNDLLCAELDLLSAFSRRLNDIASKGVHTRVSEQEAKQGLVGLYMFLYNVICKIQRVPES